MEKSKRGGWNRGLTKNDPRVKRIAELASKTLTGRIGYKLTEDDKKNLSNHAFKNKLGGHTSKMRINYNGINLHSSYEYEVAKSLDENGIKWNRPKSLKWIDSNGKLHRYYPDFYLEDFNVFLDPKNDYLIIKDFDKIEAVKKLNNVTILILNKTQLNWNSIKDLIK